MKPFGPPTLPLLDPMYPPHKPKVRPIIFVLKTWIDYFSLNKRGHSLTTLTRCWSFLTTYLLRIDICEGIYLVLNISKHLYSVDIARTTYLHHLVNIVCERP